MKKNYGSFLFILTLQIRSTFLITQVTDVFLYQCIAIKDVTVLKIFLFFLITQFSRINNKHKSEQYSFNTIVNIFILVNKFFFILKLSIRSYLKTLDNLYY